MEEQQFCHSIANLISLTLQAAERRQAEQALRENEQRTRQIIETALDAVIVMDDHGKILDWNRQAEAMFGWTASEAVGRMLYDTIIPLAFDQPHRHGLPRYLTTDDTSVLNKRIELTALHRNGTEFPIELAVSHFKRGKAHLFTGFTADISERKHA